MAAYSSISIPTKCFIPNWAATNKSIPVPVPISKHVTLSRSIDSLYTFKSSAQVLVVSWDPVPKEMSESISIIVLLSTLSYSCQEGLIIKLGRISVGSIYCCQELSHVDSSNIFVSTDVTLIFASVRRLSKSDLIVLESNDGSAYIVNLIKFG